MFGGLGSFFGGAGDGNFLTGFLGPKYSCELKCFSFGFIGREELEFGNRLIMPPAVLQKLQDVQAPSPMIFEVSNFQGSRHTHAGILEFVAQQDTCYMPFWMMRQLQVAEGDVLRFSLKQLPKAKFCRLRPASVALHRVYNPRALLEGGLKNFAALTVGDDFCVEYDGHPYGLEVVELEPGGAGTLIDTDMEVEFAPARDAESAAARSTSRERGSRPASRATSRNSDGSDAAGSAVFHGKGRRIDGRPVDPEEEVSEEYDPMPWKKRIPRGVKLTVPPYGVDVARILGSAPAAASLAGDVAVAAARDRQQRMEIASAAARERHDLALQAAQAREAANAEEIAKRRKEEAEAKAREQARLEEEEQKRKQKEEDKRRWKIEQATVHAPGKRGAKGKRRAGGLSALLRSLCRCFRGADRPAAAGQDPGQTHHNAV